MGASVHQSIVTSEDSMPLGKGQSYSMLKRLNILDARFLYTDTSKMLPRGKHNVRSFCRTCT